MSSLLLPLGMACWARRVVFPSLWLVLPPSLYYELAIARACYLLRGTRLHELGKHQLPFLLLRLLPSHHLRGSVLPSRRSSTLLALGLLVLPALWSAIGSINVGISAAK